MNREEENRRRQQQVFRGDNSETMHHQMVDDKIKRFERNIKTILFIYLFLQFIFERRSLYNKQFLYLGCPYFPTTKPGHGTKKNKYNKKKY